MADPQSPAPRVKEPETLVRRSSIIAAMVLVVLLLFAAGYKLYSGKAEVPTAPAAEVAEVAIEVKIDPVPEIDPEIAQLAKYQKIINRNIPIEIAELQARLMLATAREEDVAIELLVGIAQAESNFNPLATSSAGAAGLMQVLRGKVEIDEKQKYDIQYNLKTACTIFKEKLGQNNGELGQALTDYSGGAKWYVDKIYAGFVRYRMFRAGGSIHVSDIARADHAVKGTTTKSAKKLEEQQ